MKKLFTTILALMVVLTGCGSSSDAFVFSVSSPLESLDPVDSSYTQTFTLYADIFSGIKKVDGDGNLVDSQAESIDVSADGLVYTIKLRDDFVWVDSSGEEMAPVVAEDYLTAYQRIVDPLQASGYSYIMEPIKNAKAISAGDKEVSELGVKVIDDYTLEITLQNPTPYFESMLSFASFVPVATDAVEQFGDDYGTSAQTTWYNGPYYVTEFDTEYITSIQKNELYPFADNVQVEAIDYRLNQDSTSRYNAFLSGELDYAEITTNEDYEEAIANGVAKDQLTGYSFYAVLNHDESAATSNQNLRMALEYGFDRASIAEGYSGSIQQPIEYIIPRDMTATAYDGVEYRDYAKDSLITYDKDKANEYFDAYMEDMGYTDRSEITVSYLASADSSGNNKTAEVVQAFYLQEFGITIDLNIQPFEQFVESRRSGAFDMLITGWGPDYADPSTYLALWTTDQIGSQNNANYSNSEYDELYEKANLETDTAKRFEMFAELEQKLVDDGVLIPFYQKNAPYVLSEEYNLPMHLFFKISHEYVTLN